jgi:hypothetical protein
VQTERRKLKLKASLKQRAQKEPPTSRDALAEPQLRGSAEQRAAQPEPRPVLPEPQAVQRREQPQTQLQAALQAWLPELQPTASLPREARPQGAPAAQPLLLSSA